MRLFVAINFSEDVRALILKVQDQLRAQATKGSFSRPENFHLTLAFLGETAEEKLESLFNIIKEIQGDQGLSPSPFDIVFTRTGCFTHSRKELWWIGSDAENSGTLVLKAIQGRLVSRLEEEGFPVDKRPFNAHVTLAREVKHTGGIVLDCPAITIRVDRISLMKSEHVRGILTYTELMGRDL